VTTIPSSPTSKASLDTAKRALVYGAFDYIAKPFDLDHLSEVVAAAVLWGGSSER
jgi:DNA-binding NtrC family response regulator